MPCNPQWPEVRNALLPRQNVIDSLNIVALVFCIKFRALMAFVVGEQVFMEIKALVEIIEFRKRGVPHLHCIFIIFLIQLLLIQ